MAWFGRFWSRDAETSAMFGNVAPSEGGSQGFQTAFENPKYRQERDVTSSRCVRLKCWEGSHGVRAYAVREGLTTKDEAVC